MTHSNQRKLFVGVLGVGLGALLVDRVLLTPGGSGPPAEDQFTIESASDASDATSVPEVAVATPENSIQARLMAIPIAHGPEHCADAFAIPASWRVESSSSEQEQSAAKPAGGFAVDYSLSAVMASESGNGFATLVRHKVNKPGRVTMRVGDVIDGHKLVKIDRRSAVFEGPNGPMTLHLAEPEAARTAGAETLARESDGG